MLLTGAAYAYKTGDNGVYAPATTGTYSYNSFVPGTAGFPGVGGSYTDPVFGSKVLRLTARGSAGNDQMYGHHFANANGTYAFQLGGSTGRVISTANGAVLWSGSQVPIGSMSADLAWDAVDPDKYYYYSGASLIRRSLSAQTDYTMHTFPSALQSQGGSLDSQSADGQYFIVAYGGTTKVWDSSTNTIYAGSAAVAGSGGWITITPDGNYLVTAHGNAAQPQQEHYSYVIDHVNQSIVSTPTLFWGMGGDHGTLVSASDGKSYYIGFNTYATNPGLYRVDITLNQVGKSESQQLNANQLLIALGWHDADGHLSAVSKGIYRDWVFVDTENVYDTYGCDPSTGCNSPGGWTAYEQEIVAVNVTTLEVRRFAHHRSRGLGDGSYWNQPRISTSWDGSVVFWDSNFNVSSPSGFADLFAIQSPLGATVPPPPVPMGLHFP